MSEESVVLAVLGYYCHLDDRMRNYLNQVVKYIKSNPVSVLITSGGFTNRFTAPGVSEAALMADYLSERGGLCLPIIRDEEPLTTNENLKNIAKIIKELGFESSELVIFCDDSHSLKVGIISLVIFDSLPKIMTFKVIPGVLQKSKQVFVCTPLNLLALKIRYFEQLELRRKELRIRAS